MEIVLLHVIKAEGTFDAYLLFDLFSFPFFLHQVIGLLDVFTPARSLEEFNDV